MELGDRVTGKRIMLMATCLCDAFYDDVARASVEILEHLGCEVIFPPDQTCCGQPAFNAGDFASSRRVVRHHVQAFEGTEPVVVPSGSCAAMNFHGALLEFEGEEDIAGVRQLARRTWEIADFVVNALGVSSWPGALDRSIVFHQSCHSRETPSGEAALRLLHSIRDLRVLEFGEGEQCCGFGGTFSVTFPYVSGAMGRTKLDHLLEPGPQWLVSGDMSCLMHLGGLAEKAGRPVPMRHLVQILRDAMNNSEPSGTPSP